MVHGHRDHGRFTSSTSAPFSISRCAIHQYDRRQLAQPLAIESGSAKLTYGSGYDLASERRMQLTAAGSRRVRHRGRGRCAHTIEGETLRRDRIAYPTTAKPASIMAQLLGSGTDGVVCSVNRAKVYVLSLAYE